MNHLVNIYPKMHRINMIVQLVATPICIYFGWTFAVLYNNSFLKWLPSTVPLLLLPLYMRTYSMTFMGAGQCGF